MAGGRHGQGSGGFGPRIMAELDLSKEQQTKIENLRIEMEQRTTQVRIELRQKRGELRQLWQAEHPDERAILAKQTEMDPLRQQLRAEGVKFRVAVYEVLTPEQKTKLRDMLQQPRRHLRGGKAGGRMGVGAMGFGFGGYDGPGFYDEGVDSNG
ncbi:MAG: Spy/CpxP family protein refolding chaperone [Deltaproteobacteria bacterium]|nr:Spy/CpxP family protein refolding chaperone [Deltaproteobacteria bacterium]